MSHGASPRAVISSFRSFLGPLSSPSVRRFLKKHGSVSFRCSHFSAKWPAAPPFFPTAGLALLKALVFSLKSLCGNPTTRPLSQSRKGARVFQSMYYDLGGRAVRLLGGKSTMNLLLSLTIVLFLNVLQIPLSAARSTHMSDHEKAGLRGPVKTCLERASNQVLFRCLVTRAPTPQARPRAATCPLGHLAVSSIPRSPSSCPR
jgi:hypothetical protein